jgi:hypothetical protein
MESWHFDGEVRGCGDGRDAGFLQRVIGDRARVYAAFLDPPYNVRIGGHAVAAGSHREFAMASGEMSEAEFRIPRISPDAHLQPSST